MRTQYDIDLYCPAEMIEALRQTALAMGYEALENRERFPTDHLPPMIRKTGWEWKGDYFDTGNTHRYRNSLPLLGSRDGALRPAIA